MISKKVLASIIIGVAGVLIMTWRIVRIPAHVVVINQTGSAIQRVVIEAGANRYELGTLNNSEARRVAVDPAPTLRLTFHGQADRGWRSPEPLTPGQSVVLYVTPGDRVEARSRIGSFVR